MSFLSDSTDEWEGNKPDVKEVSESTRRKFNEKYDLTVNENKILNAKLDELIKQGTEAKSEHKYLRKQLKELTEQYQKLIQQNQEIDKLIQAKPPKKENTEESDNNTRILMEKLNVMNKEIEVKQAKVKELTEAFDFKKSRWNAEQTRLQKEYDSISAQNAILKQQLEIFKQSDT